MMNKYYIRGIQQIGIGVSNLEAAFSWYRKYFGADIKVFDDDSVAEFMLPYTGGAPQRRRAVLAINIEGGGGFEIWQYKGRTPIKADFDIQIGDLGIFAAKIKTRNLESTFAFFKSESLNISGLLKDPIGNSYFWITDPWDNKFQIVEGSGWYSDDNKKTGLVYGAVIGVPDIEKAFLVYKNILGYTEEVYNFESVFEDFAGLNGGSSRIKRVLLKHTEPRNGCFGALFGPSQIELVQLTELKPRFVFENRYWGDLGFIHICFDISNMNELRNKSFQEGFPFTVDSFMAQQGSSFDMGETKGLFSYIEDNGKTLIEFVEGHKLPIIKWLGWQINLKDRNPQKPLPRWIVKALKFKRVKE